MRAIFDEGALSFLVPRPPLLMSRSPRPLEERVARLERMVEEIYAHLGLSAEPADPETPLPPPSVPLPTEEPATNATYSAAPKAEVWAHRSEQWLGRVGLALLFLGLVYLFNYSIEQGWITPTVRVGVGMGIASLLLILGLRLPSGRRTYSQLLLAGALAVYYVSGFAAFQLYHIIGHSTAFLYMTGVMALGLALAGGRNQPALASLGAAGGFATPLLLNAGAGAVLELAIYSALVTTWTGVLFWRRGWASLLWTYSLGGLATLGIAAHHATGAERTVVQLVLLLSWFAGGWAPFLREALHGKASAASRWGPVPRAMQLRLLGVGSSTVVLFFTDRMWALQDEQTGGLFLCAAAVYALLAGWASYRSGGKGHAAAPVGATLCAAGTLLLLDDAALVVALAVEAGAFMLVGSRRRVAGLAGVGHLVFVLLAFYLLQDALTDARGAFDSLALAQLLALAVALLASRSPGARWLSWGYGIGVHALFLLWLAKELEPISPGSGWVTLAWGIYGAGLLMAALRWRGRDTDLMHGLQLVALSALALAVLKLVVVDLGRLAMVWRILLFMGFGGAFLGMSALFKPRR